MMVRSSAHGNTFKKEPGTAMLILKGRPVIPDDNSDSIPHGKKDFVLVSFYNVETTELHSNKRSQIFLLKTRKLFSINTSFNMENPHLKTKTYLSLRFHVHCYLVPPNPPSQHVIVPAAFALCVLCSPAFLQIQLI